MAEKRANFTIMTEGITSLDIQALCNALSNNCSRLYGYLTNTFNDTVPKIVIFTLNGAGKRGLRKDEVVKIEAFVRGWFVGKGIGLNSFQWC